MILKKGVTIIGLHPVMRRVLRMAERVWRENGREEGVTITAGLDGIHSAGSWHYYGLAVDFRTRYFTEEVEQKVYDALRASLPGYDVVKHESHIHVEVGNELAKEIGAYYE